MTNTRQRPKRMIAARDSSHTSLKSEWSDVDADAGNELYGRAIRIRKIVQLFQALMKRASREQTEDSPFCIIGQRLKKMFDI